MGNDLSPLDLLPAFYQDERLVEIPVTRIDHRFNTVMEVNGFSSLASDSQRDTVAVIGETLVEDPAEHLALLEGFVDPGDMAIGDCVDRWVAAGYPGVRAFRGWLKVHVGARVGLLSTVTLVGVTGAHLGPVNEEAGSRACCELLDVRQGVGGLRQGSQCP